MWSLPKIVICTSKKAQNCKKVVLKKISLAYAHRNIYWCPKGHMRKSDNFRKALLVIANLF